VNRWLIWGWAVGIGLFPVWLTVASPSGDLFGRWTDHLRHEGESVALISHGFNVYGMTYEGAVSGLALPCDDHIGLWPHTGIPYPPLGIAIHYPFALVERWVSPRLVHGTLTWLFGLVGLQTALWVASQLFGIRRWFFLFVFGPLIVGTGLSGFYDTVWLFFAARAVLRASPGDGVISFLTHFRGAATLSAVAGFKSLIGRLAACTLLGLNFAILVVVSQHLGDFETNSRLHWSRPVAWWFPLATTLVVWLTRVEHRLWLYIVPSAILMFLDRQAAFWHLLVLVPPAIHSLRVASLKNTILVNLWVVATAQAFLDSLIPFPVYWLMLR